MSVGATLPRALLQPQVELAAQRDNIDLLALPDEWDVGVDIRTEAIRRAATPRLGARQGGLGGIRPGPACRAVTTRLRGRRPGETLYFVEKALPDELFQWIAEIRNLVEELSALFGIRIAATADTRDLCLALGSCRRWLWREEARRADAWQARSDLV